MFNLSCPIFTLQATERMKLVDVLGAKQFPDSERIITQVRWISRSWVLYLIVTVHTTLNCFIYTVSLSFSLSSQGDKADCFYIVESGEVKIMMKSKVSCLLRPKFLCISCAVHLTSLIVYRSFGAAKACKDRSG